MVLAFFKLFSLVIGFYVTLQKMMATYFKLTSILIVATLSLIACNESHSQEIVKLNSQEFARLLEDGDVQLVDIRTPQEVANGIIEGASIINFQDADFEKKVQLLDKGQPVAIYCAAGGRSARASSQLKKLGFSKIYDLKDGYTGWKAEGYPSVKVSN